MSLRPMSFQDSSKACEGLGAGFGGAFFAASCARTGSAIKAAVNVIPAIHDSFFISSSVAPSGARTMFETYWVPRSVFAVRQILLPETGGRIAAPVRKQRKLCQIVSSAAHGKLKVQTGRLFCECWLAVDPAGNRLRAAFAHCLLPIFLV